MKTPILTLFILALFPLVLCSQQLEEIQNVKSIRLNHSYYQGKKDDAKYQISLLQNADTCIAVFSVTNSVQIPLAGIVNEDTIILWSQMDLLMPQSAYDYQQNWILKLIANPNGYDLYMLDEEGSVEELHYITVPLTKTNTNTYKSYQYNLFNHNRVNGRDYAVSHCAYIQDTMFRYINPKTSPEYVHFNLMKINLALYEYFNVIIEKYNSYILQEKNLKDQVHEFGKRLEVVIPYFENAQYVQYYYCLYSEIFQGNKDFLVKFITIDKKTKQVIQLNNTMFKPSAWAELNKYYYKRNKNQFGSSRLIRPVSNEIYLTDNKGIGIIALPKKTEEEFNGLLNTEFTAAELKPYLAGSKTTNKAPIKKAKPSVKKK